MINGLEGIPGSGKSYEAAVFQVLVALRAGRKVITNLPLEVSAYEAIDPAFSRLLEVRFVPSRVLGTWQVDRIDPETGAGRAFDLFEDGHTEPAPEGAKVFGHVWDYWTDWRHEKTGQGPLFVVDECHVPMPRIGTQRAVVEWFALHRHFGSDVLLCTQNFRKLDPDIAANMAMVIKVRKANVLGRSDSYIRKVHAGYRGAVIQQSIRRYEPGFFRLYRSHTQGNAVLEADASDVAPVSVKLKRWTIGFWLLAAAFGVYTWSTWESPIKDSSKPAKSSKSNPRQVVPPVLSSPAAASFPAPASSAAAPLPESQPAALPVALEDPEPYAGKGVHLNGKLTLHGRTVYMFALSSGGSVISWVRDAELLASGYSWEPKTDCFGYLRWQGKARAVICDAPARSPGTSDRPIVISGGYGSDGRVPARPSAATSTHQPLIGGGT